LLIEREDRRMRLTVATIVVTLVTGLVAVDDGVAAIRRGAARVPATFPRVVREDFVRRLAEKVSPLVAIEPGPEYAPGCCFDARPDGTCRVDDANTTCWLDAGDGCGPLLAADADAGAYWPEDGWVVTTSSPRWGEVSRAEQRRSIREILRVLAERQPARPVGLAAYAVGYIESGFNPTAEHPRTRACGLYQFLGGTWRDFARRDVAGDPTACRDPGENAAAAITFLSHLYDTKLRTIVESEPAWETMSEWERLTTIFVGLYSLHNYGPNDPRWQEPENGARRLALSHLGVLKDFYDTLGAEMRRAAPRPRAIASAKRRR
jgi:hypothetical protein